MMPVPGFREVWFDTPSQVVLAALVAEVADVDGLIIEIGSWEGRSTCALANAAYPRQVEAVDTWRGSRGEISATLALTRDVQAQFLANISYYTQGNVTPHRMDWRQYVPTVTKPVALAFIDAEHSYDEVFDNVTALVPLMAAGGIICGDDNHHPPVRAAVLDTLGDVTLDATLWIWRKP